MKIKDLITYGNKSKIKAGEAVENGKYMFFTSSSDESKRYDDYQFDCEGIVMGTGGNATLHYYNGKFSVSTDCIVLLPNKEILCKYLYYFFLFNMPILEDGFKGAGLKHTNKNYIGNIEIGTIPSIEKQKELIANFDAISSIINKRQQQLSQLDELVEAQFIEMFGSISKNEYNYETKKLKEVANVGSSHRVFTTEFVEDGIPFYRGTEISELAKGNKPNDLYYISENQYKKLASDDTKPQIGDILMPSICNKGQVWMVDSDNPFYYKDGRVLHISPNREIFNTKYLEFYMKKKTQIEYPKLGDGTTFSEFKIFLLKEFDVLIPQREKQDEFSDFVKQVDKSKFACQESIKLYQELLDKKMDEYFNPKEVSNA